jgi:thymidylate kinase
MTSFVTGAAIGVHSLFAALDGIGVRWALLRGRDGLDTSTRDVDLLVARDQLSSFEDVVFGMGGVALPARMHPWHRFYLLDDPGSGGVVKLDVVTELIYCRDRPMHSGLEAGCLDRRLNDGDVAVLADTDMFWTVLLHCLLDKQAINVRRQAELEATVDGVVRPSPGEAWFETLCPPGWTVERVLEAVRAHDWDALVPLGRQIVSSPAHSPDSSQPNSSGRSEAVRGVRRARSIATLSRRRTTGLARAAYPVLWRRAGLGDSPAVLDLAEAAAVDLLVSRLSRSPGIVEVDVLVCESQAEILLDALRDHRYRRLGRGWTRISARGTERVRVFSSSDLGMSAPAWEDLSRSASPMYQRTHSRRVTSAPVAGARVVEPVETTEPTEPVETTQPTEPTSVRRQVRISFSGLDGAGKTRQIEALKAALADGRSVEVLWVPFRIWPEPLLNRLPAEFRSRLGPKRRLDGDTGGGGGGTAERPCVSRDTHKGVWHGPRRSIRAAIWASIGTAAAVSAGLALRRRLSASSADVLVLDRYRLDSIVKLGFWYAEVPSAWLSRVVAWLAPAPDVEILLRVDPAVAYARKAEQWSLNELSRQARLYDDAAALLSVVVVDGNEDPEVVARLIESRVTTALHP